MQVFARVGGVKWAPWEKWIDSLFLPVLLTQRSSLSVLHMNSLTTLFPFFPDELFAGDPFYSFEIRFFATCSFFCDSEVPKYFDVHPNIII